MTKMITKFHFKITLNNGKEIGVITRTYFDEIGSFLKFNPIGEKSNLLISVGEIEQIKLVLE